MKTVRLKVLPLPPVTDSSIGVRRYWSDDFGRFIDCEVVWGGVGPMPHELDAAEFWRRKASSMDPTTLGHVSARER